MPGLELPGRRIEYLDEGRGEPVVLLHDSGASGAPWRSLVGRLAPRFRVLAPDLHGDGCSRGWNENGPFRLAQETALVHALLDTLEGRPAHLVGHSHGGAVALHVARPRAARLRSLTLIEPAAFHLLREPEAEDDADAQALREFRGLDLPTLILQGGATVLPTRRACQRLAGTLPRARLHTLAGAGHMLTARHRDEVEAIVVQHLEAHARRPARASA
jgi:pimeloyl-ACP methyl ester carboxylesterase